jgi:hypothetical protein
VAPEINPPNGVPENITGLLGVKPAVLKQVTALELAAIAEVLTSGKFTLVIGGAG